MYVWFVETPADCEINDLAWCHFAGDDGLGLIADKRRPVLRRGPPVAPSLRFWR